MSLLLFFAPAAGGPAPPPPPPPPAAPVVTVAQLATVTGTVVQQATNPFAGFVASLTPKTSALDVRSFAQIVGNIAAAVQGAAGRLLDYSIGSVLRALAEAEAGQGLWLQANILKTLTRTRLTTSTGTDADSFVNDWGMFRLGSVLSAGQVTFSRFSPSAAAVVPVGAQVRTTDGAQSFQVTADPSNGAYSSTAGGYPLPIGVTSVACSVQSLNPGVSANVAANTITVLVTSITGVDYCNNTGPMSGGSDPETDPQIKARFPLYIASIAEGTIQAIQFAIQSLKLGMQATILENTNADGSPHQGFLCITVDDGSGFPPQSTLDAAAFAVNGLPHGRAGGVMSSVFPPVVMSANIAVSLTVAQGYDRQRVIGIVGNAIAVYVNTLSLGQSLPYSHIAAVIFNASPGVTNAAVTLNNGTGDIVATARNVVKVGSLTVV